MSTSNSLVLISNVAAILDACPVNDPRVEITADLKTKMDKQGKIPAGTKMMYWDFSAKYDGKKIPLTYAEAVIKLGNVKDVRTLHAERVKQAKETYPPTTYIAMQYSEKYKDVSLVGDLFAYVRALEKHMKPWLKTKHNLNFAGPFSKRKEGDEDSFEKYGLSMSVGFNVIDETDVQKNNGFCMTTFDEWMGEGKATRPLKHKTAADITVDKKFADRSKKSTDVYTSSINIGNAHEVLLRGMVAECRIACEFRQRTFALDPKKPSVLTADDEISMRITITNAIINTATASKNTDVGAFNSETKSAMASISAAAMASIDDVPVTPDDDTPEEREEQNELGDELMNALAV